MSRPEVECPECEHEFNVSNCQQWSANGFEVDCPECGERMEIEVEVEEYSYIAYPL